MRTSTILVFCLLLIFSFGGLALAQDNGGGDRHTDQHDQRQGRRYNQGHRGGTRYTTHNRWRRHRNRYNQQHT
jgi:hypothetical protein